MTNILIALDLSDFSAEVVKRGYSLAERLNTSVTLVSIVSHIEYARPDTGVVIDDNAGARLQETKEALEKIKAAHPTTPTTIEAYVGDPKTNLLDTITGLNPALVVMGTHGRTGFSHLLLGSVAEYLVRHSPVPVLVIPYKILSQEQA